MQPCVRRLAFNVFFIEIYHVWQGRKIGVVLVRSTVDISVMAYIYLRTLYICIKPLICNNKILLQNWRWVYQLLYNLKYIGNSLHQAKDKSEVHSTVYSI
jgi:hypothetical protein